MSRLHSYVAARYAANSRAMCVDTLQEHAEALAEASGEAHGEANGAQISPIKAHMRLTSRAMPGAM